MQAEQIPEIKLKFLAKKENASYREVIFKNIFKYDFQLSYTEYGRFLHIYERDIDRDSTDVIIEGSGITHKVQLKTIFEDNIDHESLGRYQSPTKSWQVSHSFIKPQFRNLELLVEDNQVEVPIDFLDPDGPELGYGGTIILQRIHYSPDDSVRVSYSIFNTTLLAMAASDKYRTNFFGEGENGKQNSKTKAQAKAFFKKILESRSKKIHVGRSWFLDLNDEHMRYIGAMGIPTPLAPYGLWFYMKQFQTEKCEESYHRLQCIFSNENLLDL